MVANESFSSKYGPQVQAGIARVEKIEAEKTAAQRALEEKQRQKELHLEKVKKIEEHLCTMGKDAAQVLEQKGVAPDLILTELKETIQLKKSPFFGRLISETIQQSSEVGRAWYVGSLKAGRVQTSHESHNSGDEYADDVKNLYINSQLGFIFTSEYVNYHFIKNNSYSSVPINQLKSDQSEPEYRSVGTYGNGLFLDKWGLDNQPKIENNIVALLRKHDVF